MGRLQEILENGFDEDDFVEGVFLIEAKSENTFFNRKIKLEEVTCFSDGGFGSYEEDDEGGIWKIITSAWFENIGELKKLVKKIEKYKWLFLSDSYIMLDGEYLFADGKWLI